MASSISRRVSKQSAPHSCVIKLFLTLSSRGSESHVFDAVKIGIVRYYNTAADTANSFTRPYFTPFRPFYDSSRSIKI